MRKILFTCLGILLIPFFSNAQFWEIGVMLGGANYAGDLSQGPVTLKETHPAVGALIRANIRRTFTLKGNIYFGRISGDDGNGDQAIRKYRNLDFRSNVLEIGINGEVNFSGFEAGNRKYKSSPYGFLGIAIFKFDPQGYLPTTGEWVRLQPLGTEGQGTTRYNDRRKYSLTQVSIPFGVGQKFNLTDNWNVGFEFGWRKTFTDYLDDVSSTYPEYDYLYSNSGALAAQMSNKTNLSGSGVRKDWGPHDRRGNSTNLDWYLFGGITITYTILKRSCYVF